MRVGVLALQGDVPEHLAAIGELIPKGSAVPVRDPSDLERVEALLLPGGESTTIASLMVESGLFEAVRTRIGKGLPVLATCAGLILVSRELEKSPSGPNPPPWAPSTSWCAATTTGPSESPSRRRCDFRA
ncbi:MAG: hypothetical protein ACHQ2Y_05220 [Candidatus Lutacidiplasmatales archaeon]